MHDEQQVLAKQNETCLHGILQNTPLLPSETSPCVGTEEGLLDALCWLARVLLALDD